MTSLDERDIVSEQRQVPYRFQVNGDRMLVLSRRT
jgi:hypothetical protein